MSEARVRVSLTDGVIEFEGPEKFVADLVEKFTGVIHTALTGELSASAGATADRPEASDGAGANGQGKPADEPKAAATSVPATPPPSSEIALNDIFAATDTGVQVLRTFPGSTKAARAVNLTKLYLYGLQALKKRDTAFFGEIARVCKAHGCFDSNNMAASLKAQRTAFVFGGRGKRQTVRLSAPGIQETAVLIGQIRAKGHGTVRGAKGMAAHAIRTPRPAQGTTSIHIAVPTNVQRS